MDMLLKNQAFRIMDLLRYIREFRVACILALWHFLLSSRPTTATWVMGQNLAPTPTTSLPNPIITWCNEY